MKEVLIMGKNIIGGMIIRHLFAEYENGQRRPIIKREWEEEQEAGRACPEEEER